MTIQFRLQPESNTDEPHLNNNETLHYISLYRTYNHDKKNSDNLKRNYEKNKTRLIFKANSRPQNCYSKAIKINDTH